LPFCNSTSKAFSKLVSLFSLNRKTNSKIKNANKLPKKIAKILDKKTPHLWHFF